MKKLVSVLIVLTMIIASVSAVFALEEPQIAFNTDKANTEQKVVVTSSGIFEFFDLYAAAYKNGKMLDIRKKDISLKKGENEISTGIDFSDLDCDEVKIFIWNESMEPEAKHEYNVSDEMVKWEGLVTEVPETIIAKKGSYSSDDLPKITIEGYYGEETKTVGTLTATVKNIDVANYIGKYVTAYTKRNTLVSIEEYAERNSIISISTNQLVESDSRYWQMDDIIAYYEDGSSQATEVDIERDVKVYVNYEEKELSSYTTEGVAALILSGGTIELISNNGDSRIDYINIISYSDEAVIYTVSESDGIYSFICYKGALEDIDVQDKASCVKVYKDGEAAKLSDLCAEDTITTASVAEGYTIFYASSQKVGGEVTSYDTENNIMTIGDVEYKASAFWEFYVNFPYGKYYLNINGEIAHYEEDAETARAYALITAAYEDASGVEVGYYLQAVLASGEFNEYRLMNNAKVCDSEGNTVDSAYSESTTMQYFSDMMSGEKNGCMVATADDIKNNKNLLVRASFSGDKISRLTLLPQSASSASLAEDTYDGKKLSLGNLAFDKDSVIFSVKETGSNNVEAENVRVGKPAEFFVNGKSGYDVIAFDKHSGTKIYGGAVGFKLPVVTNERYVLTISSMGETTYKDEAAYAISGYYNGEIMDLTLCNAEAENLIAGDVVLIDDSDGDCIISDFEKLVSFNAKEPQSTTVSKTADAIAENEIYSGFGFVTAYNDTSFTIDSDVTPDENPAVNGNFAQAPAQISYSNKAAYTIVEYSQDLSYAEIYTGQSEALFDEYHNFYAYVRAVNGELSDVVVFSIPNELSNGEYGLITAVYENSGLLSGSYAQVVFADGTVEEIRLSDKATVYDADDNIVSYNGTSLRGAEYVKEYFAEKMSVTFGSTSKITPIDIRANINLFVKITLNANDEISKIRLLPENTSAVSNTADMYNSHTLSLGELNFDENTVVYSINQNESEEIQADEITVSVVPDSFVDGADGYDLIALDAENGIYGAVIVFSSIY